MCCISFDSYIKPQLKMNIIRFSVGCISFDSYIKPQLLYKTCVVAVSCISFDSYIKPQPRVDCANTCAVVYLLIPTSNHNYAHALY